MTEHGDPTPPQRPTGPLEEKGAAEWIGLGIAAADLAINAHQAFGPAKDPPPPPPPPADPLPQIELPPGVDRPD